VNVLVVGGSGGIGAAIVDRLLQHSGVDMVSATFHSSGPPSKGTASTVAWHKLDATNENQVKALATNMDNIDWLINCVGMLHRAEQGPEKSVNQIGEAFFLENIRVNTLPTLLLAKHFSRHFKGKPNTVFATVSAKVGSIEDNRLGGWYSYRASKAALKKLPIRWA